MNADPRVSSLLRASAEWRLLGLLFECPDPRWRAEIASLATVVEAADLRAAAEAALRAADPGPYHTILGPGGPAPAREVAVRGRVLAGNLLGQVRAYYAAFAYNPLTEEAPDHVSVEAGFVGYLKMKEAYARARGQEAQAEVCAKAAEDFIVDHVSHLAGPLAGSLDGCGVEYLARAAAGLLKRAGSPRRPEPGPPPPDDACGACGRTDAGAT